MNILDFIPTGKENAISKQELMSRTGIKDEKLIRDAIKKEVKGGAHIFSSSGHKGYWLSDDIDELEEYVRENEHRAYAILDNISTVKKHLYEMKNIKVTSVRQHYRRLSRGDVNGQMRFEVSG